MDNVEENYGNNSGDDMMADYESHTCTGELPEIFDEDSVNDFITNLNDWD